MYFSAINDELESWNMYHAGIFLQMFLNRLPRELRDLVYTQIVPSGYINVGYPTKKSALCYITVGEETKSMDRKPIYDPRKLVPNVSKEMAEHLYKVLELRVPNLHAFQGLLCRDIFGQGLPLGQLIRNLKICIRLSIWDCNFGFNEK